jgi:protein TonB
VHFLDPSGEVAQGSGAIGGGQGGTGKRRGADRLGMHAPSDYADRVKSQIIAAKEYPVEARKKLQECFVSYTLTVDRNGNMLAYTIDPCGNALLDAAVRDAIAKAAPFPVPPDMGAERYDIHGSLVFRLK